MRSLRRVRVESRAPLLRPLPVLRTLLLGVALGGTGLVPARALAQMAPNAPAGEESAAALLAKGADAEKGSLEEACAVYLRLLEKFPKDPVAPRARLRLGLCLAKLGRTEEARARMREARMTGKDDAVLCHDAEQALMALPPEPEKKAEPAKADGTKTDAAKPAPGKADSAPVGTTAPPAPKPPARPAEPAQDDERTAIQKKIEELDAKKKSMTEEVHRLEDAGRTEDAYALRAKVDKIVAEIDGLKQQAREAAKRPRKPAPAPTPAAAPKTETLDDAGKQRLLLALRRDKAESTAKLAEQRADELTKAGKMEEAKAAQAEAAKARAEANDAAAQLAKLDKAPAAAAAPDPNAAREAELKNAVEKSRAALKEIEGKTDPAAKEAARADLKAKEKALADFREKSRVDRLAEQMRKRGAPQWEIDERVALVHKEIELEHSYNEKSRVLRKELGDKKATDDDTKARVAALEKQKHDEVDKLRADTEERIATRARSELEVELQKKGAELRSQGLSAHEVDVKLADLRRELEARLPGAKAEKPAEKKPAEGAAKETPKDREHALAEENQRLKKRIEELERELAAARAAKNADARVVAGDPGLGGPSAADATVPPKR